MALFKKKTKDAAPPAPSSTSTDDFSDFSPEALEAAAVDAADDGAPAKGRKGRKKAAPEKKGSAGRAIKPGVAIGLNIGNDSIKVVEVQAKGNEITVTGIGMVPTPAESISNGVVMSVNALALAIRDAMSQAGIKSKKVVTSVSGTGALVVRIIEVPKMSDGELEDNMKMDADRYIPFPPSEVIMDFTALRELPSDPDSANMEVLLAAAQREIIDLHIQVLQDAKLDPRSIDVEPLAAARALTHPLTMKSYANGNGTAVETDEVDYNDVAAILNIGASGTEISILRGDILVFTRTVPTGGNALTQALVDNLGLAWSDAEQLKREMGDALAPTDAAAKIPLPTQPAADASDWSGTEPGGDNAGDDTDWGDFNEDAAAAAPEASAVPAEAGNTAPTAADSASSVSGNSAQDPFSSEFFEEGPRNNEPGEQHQQKEPDEPEISEEKAKELPTAGGKPAATEAVAGQVDSLEPGEERVLPSAAKEQESPAPTTGEAAAPAAADAAPPAPPVMFDFDDVHEPDEELPTKAEGRPVNYSDLLGEEEDDLSDLPTITPDATTTPLPSAFEFPSTPATKPSAPAASGSWDESSVPDSADLTLPSYQGEAAATEGIGGQGLDAQEESLLPSEAAPGEFGFSFGEPDAPAAPAPSAEASDKEEDSAKPKAAAPADEDDPFAAFMASAGAEAAAPPAAGTPPAPAPGAQATTDDFDLDSLFGETEAAPPAATTPAAPAPGAENNSDLGDIDLGTDDFGLDVTDFGAGLAGADVGEIDAKTLHGVLDPVLENLISEVRRSLEYHTTRYPDAAVRRVTLIGGGAKLKNLDAYLTQKLGIPTSVGNPVVQLGLRAPKLPEGYVDEHGPLFTVALGLAMRELTK